MFFSICTPSITTSTFDQELQNTTKIYPSPFSEYIQIDNKQMILESFEVLSSFGTSIVSGHIEPSGKINLVELPKGIYILKLKSSGNTIVTQKIVNNNLSPPVVRTFS